MAKRVEYKVVAFVASAAAGHVLATQLHTVAEAGGGEAVVDYHVGGAAYRMPGAQPANLKAMLDTSLDGIALSKDGRRLAEEYGLTAQDFSNRNPTGRTGFTVADVRKAIDAL